MCMRLSNNPHAAAKCALRISLKYYDEIGLKVKEQLSDDVCIAWRKGLGRIMIFTDVLILSL